MSLLIDKNVLAKYDVAGPRYTSYPTAPEWSKEFIAANYRRQLIQFGLNDKTLSLYIHLPFCESLCYFCACNKVIRPQDPKVGDEYLNYLFKEIEMVAATIGRKKKVRQLHWGGGTPTYLSEAQSTSLFNKLVQHFDIDLDGEIAIEIDPRTVTHAKLKTLRALGFNRISLGVQDFDPKVQDDINRIQPFEQVKEVNAWCRDLNFLSVNFDLIYGLPYQTRDTFAKTAAQVIGLRPDRIALYSFAYVPWLSKPQNKFNLEAIALHDEKVDIFLDARGQLIKAGYVAIAMDHFALKSDEMAKAFDKGHLHRNFMGYTLKPADEFIGLGVSAIGFLENAFVQNVKVLPDYYKLLDAGQIPTERGLALSDDDRKRQWTINQLMCAFHLNKDEFQRLFGQAFDLYFVQEQEHIKQCVDDGLIQADNKGIHATDLGKIFIRNVCMGFDAYLRRKDGHKRFSRTV